MSNLRGKVRLAAAAERQFGRLASRQLGELGFAKPTLNYWLKEGYLHRVLPHVYAVGHRAPSVEAELMAAVLHAGPGAALSHATAAWWLGLLNDRPPEIQVSTPRKCRSLPGIHIYDRRERSRVVHNRLPVTTVVETLVDLAATAPRRTLRLALANAEYHGMLHLEEIEAMAARGRRGATKLRQALKIHQPGLAHTKSRMERKLIRICEKEKIELPEINVKVDGWEVDALWRKAGLAVELDGYGNHHTPGQLRRDRRKEMALRAVKLTPIRYSEEQLDHHGQEVAAELRQATGT